MFNKKVPNAKWIPGAQWIFIPILKNWLSEFLCGTLSRSLTNMLTLSFNIRKKISRDLILCFIHPGISISFATWKILQSNHFNSCKTHCQTEDMQDAWKNSTCVYRKWTSFEKCSSSYGRYLNAVVQLEGPRGLDWSFSLLWMKMNYKRIARLDALITLIFVLWLEKSPEKLEGERMGPLNL